MNEKQKQSINPERPAIEHYPVDEMSRRVYFTRSSGEVQQGWVTGEATAPSGNRLLEVSFFVDSDIATKLIPEGILEKTDQEERERRQGQTHKVGYQVLEIVADVSEESLPPHPDDPYRDAQPISPRVEERNEWDDLLYGGDLPERNVEDAAIRLPKTLAEQRRDDDMKAWNANIQNYQNGKQ